MLQGTSVAKLVGLGLVLLGAYMCGCDTFYHIPVKVRAGQDHALRVVHIEEADSVLGHPVHMASLDMTLPLTPELVLERHLITDQNGTDEADFVIGGWHLNTGLWVHLECTKEGYKGVEGRFPLDSFRGAHDHAVLVVMVLKREASEGTEKE